MSTNKSKKRRSFVDLSDDSFESPNFLISKENTKNVKKDIEKPTIKISNQENQILNTEPNTSTNTLIEKEDMVNLENKTFEDLSQNKKNIASSKLQKKVEEKTDFFNEKEINFNFEISSEEALNKGFHFYSNDRVMNKVKKYAKKKNIKISKLITMILDKSIQEV